MQVVPLQHALARAKDEGLDLVQATPPTHTHLRQVDHGEQRRLAAG